MWTVVTCLRIVLEETLTVQYIGKKTTKSMIFFVTTLTWMYWNQQLLGEWFYMLLKLSYSNQYAFCFPFYSMYCSRVMILEKEWWHFFTSLFWWYKTNWKSRISNLLRVVCQTVFCFSTLRLNMIVETQWELEDSILGNYHNQCVSVCVSRVWTVGFWPL